MTTLPPAELKAIQPYLQRAREIRTKYPAVGYYGEVYAVKVGLKGTVTGEGRGYLAKLMEKVERDREELKSIPELQDEKVGRDQVLKVANDVFQHADTQDKAGKWTKATAVAFLAASQYYEILNYFGDIEEDEIVQKIKYARYKAADISQAIKTGRKPENSQQSDTKPEEYIPPDFNAPITIPGEPTTLTPLNPTTNPLSPPNQTSLPNSNHSNYDPTSMEPSPYQPPPPGQFSYSQPPGQSPYTPLPGSSSYNPPPGPSSYNPPPPNQSPYNQPPGQSSYQPSPPGPSPYSQPSSSGPSSYQPPQGQSPYNPPPGPSPYSQPPSHYPPPSAPAGPSSTTIQKATKHARYAISALQFDDIPTALSNLQAAMDELRPYHHS